MTIPPFLMSGTRFLVSGVVLYAWARARGESKPTRLDWRDAVITGVLMLCIGNGAVGWAEQRVPSGLAALIVAVVPLWMVLLDWMRPRGTRPAFATWAGVLVGLAGLVVLVGADSLTGHGSVDAPSAFVLMFASISWAAGSLYSRYGSHPSSSVMTTGMQMLGGGVALMILSG